MPGRLIYYYVLLCRHLRIRPINTKISERRERAERDEEEYNDKQNKGRTIFDIMIEKSQIPRG